MREQPWMRHVTHQITNFFGHKDACKSRLVLNLSQAKRIECAVRAVIKLYCTDVSCEWVSCPHFPSIFGNSFQETEITAIYQMMLKTLPTGFPWLSVVPPSSFPIDMVIEVFSSFELLILSLTLLMFWTYRSARLPRFRQVSVFHLRKHCFDATANSGRC